MWNIRVSRNARVTTSGALSKRRITLSTSGVVPMMERCGEEIGVNLAVSLHAVTKEIRDEIVPLNKKYGIEELLAACAGAAVLSKNDAEALATAHAELLQRALSATLAGAHRVVPRDLVLDARCKGVLDIARRAGFDFEST